MTTSKNLRTTITIGGSIASSLPSSTKRAVKELDRLRLAQSQDVQEANNLKTAVRGLARGSDDYRTRVAQLHAVQERINFRTDKIGAAGIAARTAGGGVGSLVGRLGALKAGLGPVGLALGGLTGIALGLGAAFTKAGAEANSILLTSARFGVSSEAFQRGTAYLRTFTQDAGVARQQFEGLLKVGQDFERVRYGEQLDPRKFLAASRLGINVNDLIRGELDPTALFEQVTRGFRDLAPEEALLRAEVLLGPQLAGMAAEVASGNLSLEDANRRAEDAVILSDRQLRQNRAMGQNIDEIRQKISELLNQVTNFLIPPIVAIAKFFGFGPDEPTPADERNEGGGRVSTQSRRVAPEARFRGEQIPGTTRAGGPTRVSAQSQRVPVEARPVGGANAGPVRVSAQSRRIPGRRFDQDESTANLPTQRAIDFASVGAGNPELVGRQGGGRVRPGEITLVGEDGPEIARFPGGTEIMPFERGRRQNAAPAAPSMMTVTQTFYVTINNPSSDLDIERSLAEAAGKVGTGSGSASA